VTKRKIEMFQYRQTLVRPRLGDSDREIARSRTTLYLGIEAVATHVRFTHRGERKTVPDHMPPQTQAWLLMDTQWCLAEAERVGPACVAMVHAMFGDKVLVRMRAVQGALGLRKKIWRGTAGGGLLARQPLWHARLQSGQEHS
jgi:hypothetical protein